MFDNLIEKIGVDVMLESIMLKTKGLSDEQADKNVDGELARAAVAYALGVKEIQIPLGPNTSINHRIFPYADRNFQRGTYRQDLLMACAHLVNEIARLDRAAAAEVKEMAETEIDLPSICRAVQNGTMPAGTDFTTPAPLAARAYTPPPPPPLAAAVALTEARPRKVADRMIMLKERAKKHGRIGMRNFKDNLNSIVGFALA